MNVKYDARACHFNMDTGCTGVEDALDITASLSW